MYSTVIKPKVDSIFIELRNRIQAHLVEASFSDKTINHIACIVSDELTIRSQSILSDMIFGLIKQVVNSSEFTDIEKQNKFYEANLRNEILSKYQFELNSNLKFDDLKQVEHALKVGGYTFVIGGAVELGVVLKAGLSLSSLAPIPLGALIAISIGAALTDYFALGPNRNKKEFEKTLDTYLDESKKQFLDWFDEVELYFNKRVEEIKLTM